ELVQWHVKPGDEVAEEQILADVMTDKANVEIPSHVAGKVVALTGKPGDIVAVGSEIIRLEVEGKGNVAEGATAPAPVASKPEPKPAPNPEPKPAPKPEAKPAPVLHSVPPPRPPEGDDQADRPHAAPAVRRRARELGIDLASVKGSGPDGRVTHEDLE